MRSTENGGIERKLFTKAANRGVMLDFFSHHPRTIKTTVAKSEMQQAILSSTAEHRDEAIRKITEKLCNNGYPDGWLRGPNKRPRMQDCRNHTKQFRFCLNIQFITDNFSYSICRILNRHKIAARLVNYRSQTIRELTQSKPKPSKKCHSKTCPAPGICQ